MQTEDRFTTAIKKFDDANAADPRSVTVDGRPVPKELVYGRQMSDWLERLYPESSERLRLAVRAQHIERWKVPRSDYPDGRRGYKRWRSDLARMHADVAGSILEEVGYGGATVARVRDLIQKRRLKVDEEAQALEDTACLVFLAHYFEDFAAKHDDDKLVEILRKTWGKMSERARAEALRLELPDHLAGLVQRAVGG